MGVSFGDFQEIFETFDFETSHLWPGILITSLSKDWETFESLLSLFEPFERLLERLL